MDDAVRLESGGEKSASEVVFSANPAIQIPSVFSANVDATLTAGQSRATVLKNTDAAAAPHTFLCGAASLNGYCYLVDNTGGGGALTVGTAASHVTVALGKAAIVAVNGSTPTFVRITPDT